MKLNIFVTFYTKAREEVQEENLSAMHLNHIVSSKQSFDVTEISRKQKKLFIF